MTEWEPIRRGKPEPATESGDSKRIIITIPLESLPPSEWQQIFNAPSGLMSTACTASVEGREVTAVSSLGQLKACVEYVDRLIEHANERYVSAVLSARDRQAKKEQRIIDESDQRLQAARDELKGL